MKLALVLSGGAARGLAHIGVIRALEERGIRPDMVVGCSMGALIGAFYAMGTPARGMEGVVRRMARTKEFERILRVKPSSQGFLDPEALEEFLEAFLGDTTIEDLPMAYAAVASDIEAFSLVVLTKGSLAAAVRASTAIPGLFPPLVVEGRVLVDGGVVNPFPVDVARRLGAERVIGVSVLRGDLREETLGLPQALTGARGGLIHEIVQELRALKERNLFSVALRSVFLSQAQMIRRALELSSPELLISVDPGIGFMDFGKAGRAVEAGYEVAKEALRGWPGPASG